jgi:hypothetical protein
LEKRRKMKMEKLQQKHENENKVCEELNIFFVVSKAVRPFSLTKDSQLYDFTIWKTCPVNNRTIHVAT